MSEGPGRPHLRLIPATAPPASPPAGDLSELVWLGHCRPSELTDRITLALDDAAARRISAWPEDVWPIGVRAAVEAVQALELAADGLGLDPDELRARIETGLDVPTPVHVIDEAPLVAYLRGLRRRMALSPTCCAGAVTVYLPDELVVRWKQAAAASGLTLDGWVSAALTQAPDDALRWELAAAAAGRQLGDWVLALSLSTSRQAASSSPHI